MRLFKFLGILLIATTTTTAPLWASGPCSESHVRMSQFSLRAVFRRDPGALPFSREDFNLHRVSPITKLRIQGFLSRNFDRGWKYDGESLLVYREQDLHSVVVFASNAEKNVILHFSSFNKATLEMTPVLNELAQFHRREVIPIFLNIIK